MKHVEIYTDGACKGNPGLGGYGAILIYGKTRLEVAGGVLNTTNNRMELQAVITSLEALGEPSWVILHSDSTYVCNGINSGMGRWQMNGWKLKPKGRPVKNVDLWYQIFELCKKHMITCQWVSGHNGNPMNERADGLSNENLGEEIETWRRFHGSELLQTESISASTTSDNC